MSATVIPIKTRVALWRANERKCFYCSEPVSFRDLEIDHVIPERISRRELRALIRRLPLTADFHIHGTQNLVPAHRQCNARKSGELPNDQTVLFFLNLWVRKRSQIQDELRKQIRAAKRDKILIDMSRLIEDGDLTKEELVQLFAAIPSAREPNRQEPIIVTYGLNVDDILKSGLIPQQARASYASVCDWLENDLLNALAASPPVLVTMTEASARNGETLSARVAFWNLNLDRLNEFTLPHWTILEMSDYSEIYTEPPDDFYAEALIKAGAHVVTGGSGRFGLRRCPQCGSKSLEESSSIDYEHDDIYYMIGCKNCGWGDWTQ